MDPDITRIQGAQARAKGLSESDNPVYKVAAMPALSGDTIEEWRLEAEAWDWASPHQTATSAKAARRSTRSRLCATFGDRV